MPQDEADSEEDSDFIEFSVSTITHSVDVGNESPVSSSGHSTDTINPPVVPPCVSTALIKEPVTVGRSEGPSADATAEDGQVSKAYHDLGLPATVARRDNPDLHVFCNTLIIVCR